MLQSLANALFGCAHRRTTFPLTPGRRAPVSPGATRQGTYVVCLDCGREFRYDWAEMRVEKAAPAAIATAAKESYSVVHR